MQLSNGTNGISRAKAFMGKFLSNQPIYHMKKRDFLNGRTKNKNLGFTSLEISPFLLHRRKKLYQKRIIRGLTTCYIVWSSFINITHKQNAPPKYRGGLQKNTDVVEELEKLKCKMEFLVKENFTLKTTMKLKGTNQSEIGEIEFQKMDEKSNGGG